MKKAKLTLDELSIESFSPSIFSREKSSVEAQYSTPDPGCTAIASCWGSCFGTCGGPCPTDAAEPTCVACSQGTGNTCQITCDTCTLGYETCFSCEGGATCADPTCVPPGATECEMAC
jgi:hypothetical protein